jgi:hypothetical protein
MESYTLAAVKGWFDILKRSLQKLLEDQVPLVEKVSAILDRTGWFFRLQWPNIINLIETEARLSKSHAGSKYRLAIALDFAPYLESEFASLQELISSAVEPSFCRSFI